MRIITIILLTMITQNTTAKPKYSTEPKWETKNNRIILETVCKDYKKGSLKNRECRGHAANIFKEKCHKEKIQKYCDAIRKFKIID